MFSLHRAHPVRAYRPRFQVLEDRTLLSTYVVDHLADDGAGIGQSGSLRYCITRATDDDTITFGVTGTINLTGALPGLYHNISINGPGPNLLTVRRDTGGNYGIFTVGATVAILGLTIANGSLHYGGDGGGIFNNGQLTVTNCTISNNSAPHGGGIANDGTLTISSSTIAGNKATGGGETNAVGLGGGIFNLGTLTLSNSTVAANSGDGGFFGGAVGGICNGMYSGTLTVSNSTISGNTADILGVGGILSNYFGTLNMRNSIVAGNHLYYDDFYMEDLAGQLSSSGYNLIGVGSDASGFVDTDLVGTFDNPIDPMLGPLQNNGGPTQTMALLAGSPALNAGDPAQLGVPDQRGVVRTGRVNIGAYQASASAFVVTAPAAVQSGVPFDVTVTAVDPFGLVALGYTGTVNFGTSDSDPGVALPADYTFTASDQGTHTFGSGFTLITPGDQTITATDTADTTITGGATVTVASGAALTHLQPARDSGGVDLFFAEVTEKTTAIP
jgi:hypothetical protein